MDGANIPMTCCSPLTAGVHEEEEYNDNDKEDNDDDVVD